MCISAQTFDHYNCIGQRLEGDMHRSTLRWQYFKCHLLQCTARLWSTTSTSWPTVATHVSAQVNQSAWSHPLVLHLICFISIIWCMWFLCSWAFCALSLWMCGDGTSAGVMQCWQWHWSFFLPYCFPATITACVVYFGDIVLFCWLWGLPTSFNHSIFHHFL